MAKGADTRQIVLDAAVHMASTIGLGGLTIGSLAGQTDMSKSGVYAHFQSKESLQLAALARARDGFIDRVVRPALAVRRGEPRLRALFGNWLAAGQESSATCLFLSAASEFDDQPGVIREQLRADHQDLADLIAQVFGTGVAEGDFAAGADPVQFAHDLYGVMLAFFHAYRLLDQPQAQARARTAFEALITAAR